MSYFRVCSKNTRKDTKKSGNHKMFPLFSLFYFLSKDNDKFFFRSDLELRSLDHRQGSHQDHQSQGLLPTECYAFHQPYML